MVGFIKISYKRTVCPQTGAACSASPYGQLRTDLKVKLQLPRAPAGYFLRLSGLWRFASDEDSGLIPRAGALRIAPTLLLFEATYIEDPVSCMYMIKAESVVIVHTYKRFHKIKPL